MNRFFSRPRAATAFLSLLLLATPRFATPLLAAPETISHPKPNSPLRRAILDALRKPVSALSKKRVIFTRVEMNVSRNFAYVTAASIDARGKLVGPRDLRLTACLRKSGGAWRVLEWAYVGDMVSIEWEKKYPAAPKKLWPQNR